VGNYKLSVCVDFHREGGIYRGEWDLHRLGEVGLAPGGGPGSWVEQPPLTFSTDSGFSSCRHVATKARAEPPQTLAGRPLGSLGLGSDPLSPFVKYNPVMMMILMFGQLHFVIPLNVPIWYLSS
jgi:hypothetical protein